jgi:hypothetical protein
MNGTWIFQIVLVLVPAIVTAILGYLLGVKQQKKQALREYITGTVKDEYPLLFSEIKRNSEYLDKYLEDLDYHFPFPELYNFFNKGRGKFMEKHHNDLFLKIDFFQKEVLPKIKELDLLRTKTKEKIFDYWSKYLTSSLPKEMADESERITSDLIKESERITQDLIKYRGSYYVLPDLLNERYAGVRDKIEVCIMDRTSHMYRERGESILAYALRKQSENVNFDEISQSLLEKAKPEIANLLEAYKELKKQNDEEVKLKLLPLLQKYISNPI